MNLPDLKLRVRALISSRAVERELDDELAFHIECETRKLIESGLSAAEARQRAVARFGPVPLAADRCRDERGISFFETLARDVSFALRTFRRAPLVALTVVSTLALGLGVIAVAFTFFNAIFLRIDGVRDPEELYAIERPAAPGSGAEVPFTIAEYEAIRRETNMFADVAASRPSIPTRIDGRPAHGVFVSGNFFALLGTAALRGRTLTQADNDDGGRPVVVLSHRAWERLFAADPAVVGREFLLNGHPCTVAGVMPEDFRGLRFSAPDYWAPLALVETFRRDDRSTPVWVDAIVRLKPGASPDAAAAQLGAWASAQPGIHKPENGIVQIVLRESRGYGVSAEDRAEAMAMFIPIFFAFGLILMIGSANIANLLLARGLSRQREIGVRLSLGASRGRIVRQLLTENLLLALAAAALGYLVSRALLAGSIHMVVSLLPAEFFEGDDGGGPAVPPGDWRVWLFLFGGAFVSTVMAGLAPALHATRLELVRAMRGEVTRDARPGRVRHILIAAQVTASALLLVCAAVFLRSTFAAATKDAGVRTDDTLIVQSITDSARPAMLQAIRQHPAVRTVAAAWPGATGEGAYVEATVGAATRPVGYKVVSPEYFDLLGVNLLRGRLFAAGERSVAAGVVVISESVAQRFWPDGNALGQAIRIASPVVADARSGNAPRPPAQVFTVIGIVRDVRSAMKAFNLTYSGIYLPTSTEQPMATLVLQVYGDPEAARRTLLDTLTRVDPAVGGITTMRMMAQLEGALLSVLFWMAVILGGLALGLTVSGLFSVLSYLVEQRRTEIGVRMALGATPRDIVRLVVSQSMRPIAFGVIAGGALAAAVAIVLLSTPAAEMIGTMVHAFDPIAYAAGLSVIVATCLAAAFVPARRAAHINPIATLRAE